MPGNSQFDALIDSVITPVNNLEPKTWILKINVHYRLQAQRPNSIQTLEERKINPWPPEESRITWALDYASGWTFLQSPRRPGSWKDAINKSGSSRIMYPLWKYFCLCFSLYSCKNLIQVHKTLIEESFPRSYFFKFFRVFSLVWIYHKFGKMIKVLFSKWTMKKLIR